MSVHSLIIPQSADALAALVFSHPEAFFFLLLGALGCAQPFHLFPFVDKRAAARLFSSFSLVFSPLCPPPFHCFPFSLFFQPAGGLATAGQTSRRGDARGSPMQLADSELQRQPMRSGRKGWGKGDGEKERWQWEGRSWIVNRCAITVNGWWEEAAAAR